MAPFIPDGVYKIRNCEFREHVADLVDGNPHGAIAACRPGAKDRLFEKWLIQNRGHGGNQILIENDTVRGSFANVRGEVPDAPLVGGKNQVMWTLVKVDERMPVFYIQSEDGRYVWELPNNVECEPIVLRRHTAKENQKWTFERIEA